MADYGSTLDGNWDLSDTSDLSTTQGQSKLGEGDSGSLPEIDPAEIEFATKIGEGSYGQVFSGKCRGKNVAIKVFKPDMFQTPEERQAIREEVRIMSKIFHPNVVLFMGACTLEGNNIMIISELLPTDLETLLIREQKNISLIQRLKMAKDAALGMNWLHSSNPIFIHRDLKLSNLLVDNTYSVKVCDFGLAQMKPREVASLEYDPHGSPLYMAPEVFVGDYNEKCDIYSFGIVLWEIYTQTQAFEQVSDNLPSFIHAVCENHFRPEIPDSCYPTLAKLMTDCWSRHASQRPTFQQIINRLEEIMFDIAINDTEGKQLWKNVSEGSETVPWEEFKVALCDFLQIPTNPPESLHFELLEAIIAEKSKHVLGKGPTVSFERFGEILAWFGPLDQQFFERIEQTLSQKFFHGFLSTTEASEKLRGQPKGTYLIRFSTSSPGCFTISNINKNKKLVHQRVVHTPGKGFFFWDTTYPDLRSLIKGERKKQFFVQACPGSQYQKLLKKKSDPLDGGYVGPTMKK